MCLAIGIIWGGGKISEVGFELILVVFHYSFRLLQQCHLFPWGFEPLAPLKYMGFLI